MKVPAHLVGLYHRTLRRYRKLTVRLQREADPNGFSYRSLMHKLRKLRRKLSDLQIQLRIATATGALAVGLSFSSQAQTTHNGPFVRQPRHINPLREPLRFYDVTFPSVVDLDKDGDFDMVVADESNYYYDYGGNSSIAPMRYFVNTGSNANPVYEEKFDNENPFYGLDLANRYRGPVFADIDKDGDQDLFVGVRDYGYSGNASGIVYFRNDNGSFVQQTGAWNPATKSGNPFSSIEPDGNYKIAFADVDKDNDLDAVVGGTVIDGVTGSVLRYISYYKNDGNGTFTDASNELTLTPAPNEWWLNPALADVDKDGDIDLLLGGYYFGLRYYKQVSPGNFVEETGEYNPTAKTGNPFDGIYFPNTQPIFADLDNDADADLLLGEGDGDHYYNYPANIIHYFTNEGNGVYKERPDLENPMGGVYLRRDTSPVFADLDNDGDLDALIGHKYDNYFAEDPNTPRHYEFDNGLFRRREYEDSEFGKIDIAGNSTPALVDIDGDGDRDFISGTYFGEIVLYRNNNGEYILDDNTEVFDAIDFAYLTSPEFADLDGDGDFDMVVGSRYHLQIHYYENVGTAQAPVFEERDGNENPLSLVTEAGFAKGYLDLADVDHDGDVDAVVVAYDSFKYYEFNLILYYENTGTPAAPNFQLAEEEQPFFDPQNPFGLGRELQPTLADQDGDGDLDLFVGEYYGTIRYIRNENPAVVTSVSAGPLTYDMEAGGDLVIDPTLTLSDEDDDLVVRATVGIGNYQSGDELHFVSQPGIAGNFDPATGVLTLTGKATRAAYQTTLQTVTYHHHADETGRTKRNLETVSKAIEFRVFDTDFTTPEVASRVVNAVFANTDGEIQVFNAVAPNSTGDNKFMRIVNLPERNQVTIYSRWGDKVFEVDDYDSATPGKRFEGKNDNGKSLGTGTYFYKIEIPDTPGYTGPRLVTGYLTLKQ